MSEDRIAGHSFRPEGSGKPGRSGLRRLRHTQRPDPVLDADDWLAIDQLLTDSDRQEPTENLSRALAQLEAQLTDSYLSADTVINLLLDLWASARAFGTQAAAPVERFLSCLTQREIVTRSETQAVAEAVRRACEPAEPGGAHRGFGPANQP